MKSCAGIRARLSDALIGGTHRAPGWRGAGRLV